MSSLLISKLNLSSLKLRNSGSLAAGGGVICTYIVTYIYTMIREVTSVNRLPDVQKDKTEFHLQRGKLLKDRLTISPAASGFVYLSPTQFAGFCLRKVGDYSLLTHTYSDSVRTFPWLVCW